MARIGVLLLLTAVLVSGCARDTRPARGWVAESARRHAEADRLLQSGRRPEAVQVLRELRDSLRRQEATRYPGGRMALQDVHYRLGDLSLQAGEAREALEDCDQGLAVGAADDLFTANLLVVRGTAHERLGHVAAAAEDLHRALLINERLLGQTLERR